jgi:hypothetical protein
VTVTATATATAPALTTIEPEPADSAEPHPGRRAAESIEPPKPSWRCATDECERLTLNDEEFCPACAILFGPYDELIRGDDVTEWDPDAPPSNGGAADADDDGNEPKQPESPAGEKEDEKDEKDEKPAAPASRRRTRRPPRAKEKADPAAG